MTTQAPTPTPVTRPGPVESPGRCGTAQTPDRPWAAPGAATELPTGRCVSDRDGLLVGAGDPRRGGPRFRGPGAPRPPGTVAPSGRSPRSSGALGREGAYELHFGSVEEQHGVRHQEADQVPRDGRLWHVQCPAVGKETDLVAVELGGFQSIALLTILASVGSSVITLPLHRNADALTAGDPAELHQVGARTMKTRIAWVRPQSKDGAAVSTSCSERSGRRRPCRLV